MTAMHRDDDRLWGRIRRVFRLPFTAARLESEIDEELRFHIEGRIEELMASEGLSRERAEREARRRFGDFAYYRREAREIDSSTHQQRRRLELRDAIRRETTRALRALGRTPGFTTVTILTLALGIGAATAIFTLLDAVVLRPLPYADAHELVELSSPVPRLKGQSRWGLARHEVYWFLGQGRTLDNLGVYTTSDVTLLGGGAGERPEKVRWARVSASLFDVLKFVPQHGRLLNAQDNSNGRSPSVVVLGDGFWRTRFGGDPAIVGKRIVIEGFPLEVVGVLPPRANLPDLAIDVWGPAWIDSTTNFNNHTWSAIGRLAKGYSRDDAQRELAALTPRMAEAYPDIYRGAFFTSTGFTTEVRSLRDAVVGDTVIRALWTLFASVALVLLIAGANVANLYLVRIDARRRDVAVSAALGASRSHLAIQYLTESLMLALGAAVFALGIAQTLLAVLLRIAPSELPRLAEVRLGGASIAFALGVAALSGVVFGLLPLLAARPDIRMLRESGRGLTTSRRRMAVRQALVGTQMALAVVLLACAGLMLRTFQNLRAARPGFEPAGVLALEISLPSARYQSDEALTGAFHEQVVSRVQQLPGVRLAALSARLPLLSGDLCNGINLQGATPEDTRGACPPVTQVSPGYFEAMGTRVDGRTPTWDGMRAGDGAIVVSRAFAAHYWPNESAIGKAIQAGGRNQTAWYRVVGVAEDVSGSAGFNAPPLELVYFPARPIPGAPLWGPMSSPYLVVKVDAGDPLTLAGAIGRLVAEIEPQAAVSNAQTMETVLARSMAKQSFTMVLLLVAAAIAMLLSAVGIYGVISYVVAQRRGEIGVRVALGADVRGIITMVLRQSLGTAVIGVAAGVVAAIGTTRFLQMLLFGVSPNDATTFVAVPLLLLVVATLASYAPARRAARVDPSTALRSE